MSLAIHAHACTAAPRADVALIAGEGELAGNLWIATDATGVVSAGPVSITSTSDTPVCPFCGRPLAEVSTTQTAVGVPNHDPRQLSLDI